MNLPDGVSDIDELLTAYLDGELSEAERRMVQARLTDEAPLRQKLHELQSAWDLLDEMPETPVDQAFTKSTLELVALRAEQDEGNDEKGLIPTQVTWLRGIPLFILLTCSCLMIGIIAGWVARRNHRSQELRNLPIVANYTGLRVIENREVASAIAEIPDLDQVAMRLGDLSQSIMPSLPESLKEREQWIEKLNVRQKSILWANERDMARSADEVLAAKKLYNELEGHHEGSKRIELAISIVSALYSSLSTGDRDSLRYLSTEGKTQRLKELIYRQLGDWYAESMSDADREIIREWCRDPDFTVRFEFLRSVGDTASVRRQRLAGLLFTVVERDPRFDANVQRMIGTLDPKAGEIYHGIAQNEKLKLLASWIDGAISGGNLFSYEELWRAYDRWKDLNHENYDLLPYSDVESELRREIMESKRPRNNPNQPLRRRNDPEKKP